MSLLCHHSTGTPKPNSNSPEPEFFHRLQLKSPAPAPQHCEREHLGCLLSRQKCLNCRLTCTGTHSDSVHCKVQTRTGQKLRRQQVLPIALLQSEVRRAMPTFWVGIEVVPNLNRWHDNQHSTISVADPSPCEPVSSTNF